MKNYRNKRKNSIICVSHKINDQNGKPVGVAGIDVELKLLFFSDRYMKKLAEF